MFPATVTAASRTTAPPSTPNLGPYVSSNIEEAHKLWIKGRGAGERIIHSSLQTREKRP